MDEGWEEVVVVVGEGGKGMSACLLHCICMCVCVRAHVRNHSCGGGDPAAAVINFHGPRPAVVVAAAASTHPSLSRGKGILPGCVPTRKVRARRPQWRRRPFAGRSRVAACG